MKRRQSQLKDDNDDCDSSPGGDGRSDTMSHKVDTSKTGKNSSSTRIRTSNTRQSTKNVMT